jgi:hypothetical protein|tara:strand:- start:1745 stop:2803 length:1059 start_codon:yes stop_codon:yes gene_type:complete
MKREESHDKMATAKYGYNDEGRWVVQNEDEVKIPADKRCLGVRSGRRGWGNTQCSNKATQKNQGILCKKCMDDAQESVHSIVSKSIDAILEIDPHADANEVEAWIKDPDQQFREWKDTPLDIYFGYGYNTETGKFCLNHDLIEYNQYITPTFITDRVEARQEEYTGQMSGWFDVPSPIIVQNNGECHGRYGDMQEPEVSKRRIESNLLFISGEKTPVGVWNYNGKTVQLYLNYKHATHVQVVDGDVQWFIKKDGEYELFPSATDIKEHDKQQRHNKSNYGAIVLKKANNLVQLIYAYADGNDELLSRLNRQMSVVEECLEWQEQRRATNQQMNQAWLDAETPPSKELPDILG